MGDLVEMNLAKKIIVNEHAQALANKMKDFDFFCVMGIAENDEYQILHFNMDSEDIIEMITAMADALRNGGELQLK